MPSAPRKPRVRCFDPAKVRAALEGQVRAVRDVVAVVCAEPDAEALLAAPSGVGKWTAGELITHLTGALEMLPLHIEAQRSGESPSVRAEITLPEYAAGSGARAAEVAERAVAAAEALAGQEPNSLVAALDRAAERLFAALADTGSVKAVPTVLGAMSLPDYVVTRLVEVVVHGDDLATATGTVVRHDRQALATVTRLLADVLAAKAPGGSVEVRIPPFAVTQCVAGPQHTRGTPPNVVETDPITWIRLATGRLTWADALDSTAVTASGERADLSAQLPLLT
ncbi:sterol carrier family protein [Streptomyces sp. UNOB3_S3]|uniref:sterol carrier family protein n=1 Tax=Streptomyces sp. UNOB3_S3 TaxID=2871682 RepID=UPI001E48A897|nr:sterol carrier family protein [Streptomyces sp. UNOB3_S3]MCC3775221.1 maleylpyruvate isomerase family mycothiol-dependent enzyme [Streptomyces sp. UNOB3_S3]